MFNFFRKKKNRTIERKSSIVPLDSSPLLAFALGNSYNLSGFSSLSSTQAFHFYDNSSAVSTAIDMIADEAQYISPVVQKKDGTITDSHKVLDALEMPNMYQTRTEFMGAISRQLNIVNNAYIYASGNINRPPLELYAAKPQNITTLENRYKFPGMFNVTQGLGTGSYSENVTKYGARYYDGSMRELYHISGFSSRADEISGTSPMLAIVKEIQQQIKGNIHNVKLLENGGRLSLLVTFTDQSDTETLRARKAYVEQQFAGEAGAIATINSNSTEIQEMGMNNKDMDYALLQDMANKAVYTRYKIPLPLISTDASTFNNMETAVISLYERAVLPQVQRIFTNLTRMLMPRYGIVPTEERITYNPESIAALIPKRLENLQKRKDIGIETPNELRESLPNRENINGGDVLLVSANQVPIDQLVTGEIN